MHSKEGETQAAKLQPCEVQILTRIILKETNMIVERAIEVLRAIEILDYRSTCRECVVPGMECDDCEEAFKIAHVVLKKQIPAPPKTRINKRGFRYDYCRKCGHRLVSGVPKFCDNCGQAVKWG